jgi:hypothetical protein
VIRIYLEVVSGAACSRVLITAESIKRAVDLARVRYPGSKVEVPYPIDPEAFFTREASRSGEENLVGDGDGSSRVRLSEAWEDTRIHCKQKSGAHA